MGYCFSRDALLMVVADGMGGHMRGDVAAQLSMQTVAALFQEQARPRLKSPSQFLNQAIQSSHRALHRYQAQNQLEECPRTTIVVCVVQQDRAWWAHVGDSRLYIIRGGRVHLRTRDHSKVESLLTMGFIAPSEVARHPDRNKVLNCIGSPFDPTVTLTSAFEIQTGDRLLLCSDGLWSAFKEDEMVHKLLAEPVQFSVPRLVTEAVRRLGEDADNTTAVAMHWVGTGLPALLNDTADTLSTGNLPAGVMTTTIGMADSRQMPGGDLSEADIEKTIVEIQQAIQRSSGRYS